MTVPDYSAAADIPFHIHSLATDLDDAATVLSGNRGAVDTSVTNALAALNTANGSDTTAGTLLYAQKQRDLAVTDVGRKASITGLANVKARHERQTAGILTAGLSHARFTDFDNGIYDSFFWKVITLTGPAWGRVVPVAATGQTVGDKAAGWTLTPILNSGTGWWFVARQPFPAVANDIVSGAWDLKWPFWGQAMSNLNPALCAWQTLTSLAVDVVWYGI